MTLNIGLIGCGGIGQEHARRLQFTLNGARVVAINDLHRDAAVAFADKAQIPATFYDSADALIQAPEVQAVVVASWGPAHEEQVLACIAAGKPVFCEKPLAVTAEGARRIVEAEMKHGKNLVQVGFMRRYDAGYRALKAALDAGTVGDALLVHAAHRNPAVPEMYVGDMNITDTFIHEIDVFRWLLNDEYTSVQVIEGRKTRHAHAGLHDPVTILLETRQGIRIDTEIFVACRFGYDIQCHVVGETGVASLPEPLTVPLRSNARQGSGILMDWKLRFIESYDVELQDWINATVQGKVRGPDAWDGYVASVTAEACIEARKSKQITPINLPERPAFYA
ncbi:Gfo/Idh/MocA family oxidoreductase [Ideonella livida]|uniref:Inositol 2-dehydrogenase n=1 Tax=Ideonella livida TaxID=2707176 RepID=A0A7C9PIL0_9BURK|nr:Gfo/Idh/MocA family oxidoreductase [Ideonella livida]NDY92072.1 Gfo/Idh/MocA family oxidoreductase [Ideonella livida]